MAARRKPDLNRLADSQLLNKARQATSGVANNIAENIDMPSTAFSSSPFFPTSLEILLLLIYPVTLALGSLYTTLSNSTKDATYSAATQSFSPNPNLTFWAKKRNPFNTYFVKIGWFWTTLALVVFAFTHPTLGRPLTLNITRRRAQAVARWAGCTLIWYGVTQWFFGPPLIDRGFYLTGGVCAALQDSDTGESSGPLLRGGKQILTGAVCKAAGGRWQGGYDISGHVFLLILGSGLLWFEILPAFVGVRGLRDGRRVRQVDGRVTTAAVVKETEGKGQESDKKSGSTSYAVTAGLGVATFMWYMLLITAAYFHTWPEKFTGLVVAFAALWAVYILPRNVPKLRNFVGMPGV